jgi:two-component system, OmpR family, phosphate regulon sensor histidine kinase PhoR
MNLGIGSRLLVASLIVVVVLELIAALVLRSSLGQTVETQVTTELTRHAASARAALGDLPDLGGDASRQTVARLAAATATRVEIIRADGVILADSAPTSSPGDPLARPEVRAALDPARRVGSDRRGERILVALPLGDGAPTAVIRVSTSDDVIASAEGRIYRLLAIGAVVGVLISIGMTLITTSLVRRQIRRLADSAGQVASGGARRIALGDAGDELHLLGTTFNQVAADGERAMKALAAERALLASVLDSLTQGVIAVDGSQRIRVINPAATALLELPGVPIGEALIDQVRYPPLLDALAAGDGERTAELTTPGGVRVKARVAPRRGGDGHIVVLEDVTAMRRLETIRRDFVANASHELRTPVSVIRANAETLLAGAKDEPAMATRLIAGLGRNAERLARLVADLLDLSRIESGQLGLARAPVAVAPAVAQAEAAVEELARQRKVAVEVELEDDLAIRGDASALDQILVNLVDNAVKYTAAGGHVWISAHKVDGQIRFEVSDDGPGVAPHQRERVFERFYRVDPGRSREQGGTGLGLAIVKHLVEAMAGRIGVDSNQPTGALFWFELPAA